VLTHTAAVGMPQLTRVPHTLPSLARGAQALADENRQLGDVKLGMRSVLIDVVPGVFDRDRGDISSERQPTLTLSISQMVEMLIYSQLATPMTTGLVQLYTLMHIAHLSDRLPVVLTLCRV
jgi:hypothetical protein